MRAFSRSSCTLFSRSLRSFSSSSTSSSSSTPALFDKVLVANRGEIACRVFETCRALGLRSVAVFSEPDAHSKHVALADEAHLIGPAAAKESYLRGEKILEVAKETGARAIHPGYGFLSENAHFADACEKAGITFIGPPSSAIRSMGDKSESKSIMEAAGVPCVPGYHGPNQDPQFLAEKADEIGYPLMIKAVMGGGGKGMRVVESREKFMEALEGAKREAMSSFNDDVVLLERYLVRPRHIELQVFADQFGDAVYLFERDCSVQRRHQKILEEAPAPGLSEELRAQMGTAAVNAAKAVNYRGAGTVEFIFDVDTNDFFFMEMNTRLQVEHPVTEMITNQDLVEWQLLVASGYPLPLTQEQILANGIDGHSFEARIYAEDPDNQFLPQTGTLKYLSLPEGDNVRVDTGVRQGDSVSPFYDPMIAKLVVKDRNRTEALRKLNTALDNYQIVGLPTNIPFLRRCASHPAFAAGDVETGFIPKFYKEILPSEKAVQPSRGTLLAAATAYGQQLAQTQSVFSASAEPESPWGLQNAGFRLNGTEVTHTLRFIDDSSGETHKVELMSTGSRSFRVLRDGVDIGEVQLVKVEGQKIEALVDGNKTVFDAYVDDEQVQVWEGDRAYRYELEVPAHLREGSAAAKGSLMSPMPGRIIKVVAKPGSHVKAGDPVVVMEAMKMEHTIRAPADGVVKSINFEEGALCEAQTVLAAIDEDAEGSKKD